MTDKLAEICAVTRAEEDASANGIDGRRPCCHRRLITHTTIPEGFPGGSNKRAEASAGSTAVRHGDNNLTIGTQRGCRCAEFAPREDCPYKRTAGLSEAVKVPILAAYKNESARINHC